MYIIYCNQTTESPHLRYKRKHQLCNKILLNLSSLFFFFKAMGSQRKSLILKTQIMAENYRNSKYRKAVHVS